MINTKQRKYLKKLAHSLMPIFQVGKAGVGDTLVISVAEALEARELIKISVLQNSEQDVRTTAEKLAEGTGALVVSVIGRKIILYKESVNHKKIFI